MLKRYEWNKLKQRQQVESEDTNGAGGQNRPLSSRLYDSNRGS